MAAIRIIIGFIAFIANSVLIGVFTSLVLFISAMSIITKQFPPDFGLIRDQLVQVPTLLKELNQVAESKTRLIPPPKGPEMAMDVEQMIRVHESKINAGRQIAGVIAPLAATKSQLESKLEMQQLQGELESLKTRVMILENQLDRQSKRN